MASSENGNASSERRIDDLVARCLDALVSGESVEPEQVLAEHPDVGAEVLSRLEAFRDLEAAARADDAPRTLGDYTIRRRVGRGGFGVV